MSHKNGKNYFYGFLKNIIGVFKIMRIHKWRKDIRIILFIHYI
jgi:hypothetical protein